MKSLLRDLTATALAALLATAPTTVFARSTSASSHRHQKEKEKDNEEAPASGPSEETILLSPFVVSADASPGYTAATTLAGTRITTSLRDVGSAITTIPSLQLGATVGGAQDINFFRSGAGDGDVPHPATITAEGLFSEHDLPLDLGQTSDDLFVVQTAAIPARLPVLPAVTHLAQLGFSSGLAAATWHRAPLNLVAVVDKSGSMSGQPLALVRQSLHEALRQLGEGDQFSIVLYGDRSYVHLAPTPVANFTRQRLARAIDDIASNGSTNMEAGLEVGYQLARTSGRDFTGTTRVMLFTDERPNVGNTAAAGFMGLAEAAARDGIGLTTIGVGVQFGAELATRISGVRGGNLFFFPDGAEMTRTFTEDFDTLVTELARDFNVRIAPTRGFRIAGVFGLPSNLLRWDGDAIVLNVATIFASKRKGAIYFALGRDDAPAHPGYLPDRSGRPGEVAARVDFAYTDTATGQRHEASSDVRLLSPRNVQAGLSRGVALVDEYLTLRRAASAHLFENDQETAYQLTRDLARRFDRIDDPTLAPERQLIANVHETFAQLSGHGAATTDRYADETATARPVPVDDLTGLPTRS